MESVKAMFVFAMRNGVALTALCLRSVTSMELRESMEFANVTRDSLGHFVPSKFVPMSAVVWDPVLMASVYALPALAASTALRRSALTVEQMVNATKPRVFAFAKRDS